MSLNKEQVLDRLRAVMDPELPGVNIVDLGMIDEILLTEHGLSVTLMPTFLGCPALELIVSQVKTALNEAGSIDVQWSIHHTWSSDRITDEGRQALRAWGIAPPRQNANPVSCPYCGSATTAPLSRFGRTLCQQLYYCKNCSQPFDRFKSI